jgi:hypothetical protein
MGFAGDKIRNMAVRLLNVLGWGRCGFREEAVWEVSQEPADKTASSIAC